MTTVALLGFLFALAAPIHQEPPRGELCIIDQPVDYITRTDPTRTVAAHCSRPTAAERAAVAEVDGTHLRRGVYHLFIVPNPGPLRIEWTGAATGTQIFVSVWNGKAFEISDLRGQPDVPVTHARDVRRPASEAKIYILVNSTNGDIRTDGFRVRPLPPDVAVARTATPRPDARHRGGDEAQVFWALCRGDYKVVLIASSTANGVAGYTGHDLEHLVGQLGDATWYALPSAPTARAQVVPFGAPTLLEEDGGFRLLEIGGCSRPGAIFATAPTAEFRSRAVEGPEAVRAMRRSAVAVAGREVEAVRGAGAPGGRTGVRLCRGGADGCFGWMLLDATRRVQRLPEAGAQRSWLSLWESVGPREERQARIEAARWLKPRGESAYWVGLVLWEASTSECDGETCGSLSQEGVWLVWMHGAKLLVVKVVAREVAA